ncbi:MAG: ferritin family protein [Actinomycetota bacterium]
MKLFKCRICRDPYIGTNKPSHCPYCGAPQSYIVSAWGPEEDDDFELSELSRANLEHALMLENSNALFYRCAKEVSADEGLSLMFKALAKIEAEHASIIRKVLGLPRPTEIEDCRGRCHAWEQANLSEANDREKKAIDFYLKSAEEAVEPRVKEVFSALVEIEKTHLELLGSVAESLADLVRNHTI